MTVGVLEAILRVRDEMTGTLAKAGAAVRAHGEEHATLDRTMGKSVMTGTMLGNVLYNVASAVATTAFGMAAQAIIGMNSELETSTMKFATLTGDAEKAKQHVADLFEFAKKTPFETGPVIQASVKLQTFGGAALDTKKNLTLLGDASAATGAPINELGFWVGRMYAAVKGGKPFGEAAMRLQELAVMTPAARDEMERLQKSGAKADEVFGAFQSSLEKFSGAMVKQAGTWTGVTSTLKDVINLTVAGALQPVFEDARDAIGSFNAWLEKNESTVKAWGAAVTDGYRAVKYAVQTEVMPVVMALWSMWKAEWALMGPAVMLLAGALLDTFVVALRATEIAARAMTDAFNWVKGLFDGLPQPVKNITADLALLTIGLWALNAALTGIAGSAAYAAGAGALGTIKTGLAWFSAFGWESVTMGFGMVSAKIAAFASANPIGAVVVVVGSLSIALRELAGISFTNQLLTVLEWIKDGPGMATAGALGRKMAEGMKEAAKQATALHSGLLPLQTMTLPPLGAVMAVPPSFTALLSGPAMPRFNGYLKDTADSAAASTKKIEELKKASDGLFGADDIAKANLLVGALGGIQNVSKLTAEGMKQLWDAFKGGQAALKAAGKDVSAEWNKVMDALSARELETSMSQSRRAVDDAMTAMGKSFGAFSGTLPVAMFAAKGFGQVLTPLPGAIEKITNAYGTQVPYVSAVINKMGQITKITDAHGKTLKVQGGVVQESTKYWEKHSVGIGRATDVVDTLSRAAEMSGHKTTAALLSAGSALAKSFATGGVWGVVITGIGLAITGLVKLFSKSEGKKVNDLRDTFMEAQGGYEKLHQKLIDANAGALYFQLQSAKNQKDYDAALKAVNAALDAQTEKLAKQKQLAEDITATEQELAGLRGQLADLSSWDKVSGVIEKYGMSLDALGPKIQQIRINAVATELLNDYETIVRGGGEAGIALEAMARQFSDVVQSAAEFGDTVPVNMRPMIEKLVEMGRLTADNGDLIKDISFIKWGAPVETEADKITAAITKLVDKLGELVDQLKGLPSVSQHAADQVTRSWSKAPWSDWPNAKFPEGGDDGSGLGYAGGTHGRYLNFGAGTPVTLHGYERVMTAAEGRAGGGLDLSPLLAELQNLGTTMAAVPAQVARATRDAILTVGS